MESRRRTWGSQWPAGQSRANNVLLWTGRSLGSGDSLGRVTSSWREWPCPSTLSWTCVQFWALQVKTGKELPERAQQGLRWWLGGWSISVFPLWTTLPPWREQRQSLPVFHVLHSVFPENVAVSNRKRRILIRSIYCKWKEAASGLERSFLEPLCLGRHRMENLFFLGPPNTQVGKGIEKNVIICQDMQEKA